MKNRVKLIVVDPKFTNLTAKADLCRQVRPATDGASALGMLNYIIEKELCDKEFVNKFYFGFDQLKQRVKEYPLRKGSEITRVPEEDILQAATMYATLKPASLALYMGLSVNTNTMQAMRAVHLIIALTGNVDVKGGNLIFGCIHLPITGPTHPKVYPGLHEDEMAKAPTVKDRPIYYSRNALLFGHSHPSAFFDILCTGEPYKIKLLLSVTDPAMGMQSSRKTLEALKKVDFFVDIYFFISPTASVADILLFAATYLERDKAWYEFYHDFFCAAGIDIGPVGECRDEVEVFIELAKRLGVEPAISMSSVRELNDWYLTSARMTFDGLKRKRIVQVSFEHKKYEEEGYSFPAETGKIELYSKHFEKYGYDPLPCYREPPQSPYSTPDLFEKYPLILIFGKN